MKGCLGAGMAVLGGAVVAGGYYLAIVCGASVVWGAVW